jgi:hypothetical protein
MTKASTGLGKALARAVGGNVQTLSEMSAADIMANLSDEQKAELSASLPTPAAAADAAESATEPLAGDGEADNEGGEDTGQTGDDVIADDQNAAASDRVKAVAAAVASDDACKGKADLALQMLADDDFAGLSASGIVKLLGKTPVPDASAGDMDAADRAAMRARLAASGNSNLDPNSNAGANSQDASAVWDRAYAKINPTNNAKA